MVKQPFWSLPSTLQAGKHMASLFILTDMNNIQLEQEKQLTSQDKQFPDPATYLVLVSKQNWLRDMHHTMATFKC